MQNKTAVLVAALLTALPLSAEAAESVARLPAARSGWLLNGGTLGTGHNALHAQLGWPGLDVAVLHGASPTLDVGASLGFNYGFEGIPDYRTMPGIKLNGLVRLSLAQQGKMNVGVRVSPGVFVYFDEVTRCGGWPRYCNTEVEPRFGLGVPVELVAGFLVLPQLSVNAGISVPLAFQFTQDFAFLMPILPGFGAEYQVTRELSLTFDTRFGPSIVIGSSNADVDFAFRTLLGAGYRF